MKKMNFCFYVLCSIFFLSACTAETTTDYLREVVTEEQTILTGDAFPNKRIPTKIDIICILQALNIDVKKDDYEFQFKPDKNLVYHMKAKNKKNPDFNVYSFDGFILLTCDRDDLEELYEKEMNDDTGYTPISWGTCIGYYNIGKAAIPEDDTESITKAETYLMQILPNLYLEDYERQITHGDAGTTDFSYYAKDRDVDSEENFPDLFWSSNMNSPYIFISIYSREKLDELLGLEK